MKKIKYMIASCLNYKNKIINMIKKKYVQQLIQYQKMYSQFTWCSHFYNAPSTAH